MPPPGYVPASNGQATAGLILGIAGLTVLVLGMGVFFFVSLPCSILAWVFGANMPGRIGALIIAALAAVASDAVMTAWPHSQLGPLIGEGRGSGRRHPPPRCRSTTRPARPELPRT